MGGALLLLLCYGCEAPNPSAQWTIQVKETLQNNYKAMHDSSAALEAAVKEHCAIDAEQPATLISAQEAWRLTMANWEAVQWAQFGPILENNDHWKIQFWPDKKNIVARKVTSALASDDPITVATITDASVVVQGLSALELLLFDDKFAPKLATKEAKLCELTVAIASRYEQTSAKIVAEWQDINPANLSQADILQSLLTHVEKIKIDKLGLVLGKKTRNQVANGYFAESWRSKQSFANIQANFFAIKALLGANHSGFGLAKYLNALGHPEVADALVTKVDAILTTLETFQQPLMIAVKDPESKSQVEILYQQIEQFNEQLRNDLVPALGIALGFNANDGD